MFPSSSSGVDLSRTRLRQISSWIRDDLDILVARDGPDKLRSDDVLTLHEVFQALRLSETITGLDLRATGIHRAIMEVAGVATRWPGKLIDDCDRIISVWNAKFGSLQELRPFMYGRGGRLEGIANAHEYTRGSLLERWKNTCPENIDPASSRRTGDLGFAPGAWWINPLFAHHAGIIDLETTDGGVCFDKNAAYAVLLLESSEVDAISESEIIYRCKPTDKGRYRLTAATARGRTPVRILRSHSLNSVWGPRVGVRYEGLYKVTGWAIRPAKRSKTLPLSREAQLGDIVYEVNFERIDVTPMKEVMRHPTAIEVDDYIEYKRLKRSHRLGLKHPAELGSQAPKAGPPIIQPISSRFEAPSISPHASRRTTFKGRLSIFKGQTPTSKWQTSAFKARPPTPSHPATSPLSTPTRFFLDEKGPSRISSKGTSPKSLTKTDPSGFPFNSWQDSVSIDRVSLDPSNGTVHTPRLENIREVVPWIDHDTQSIDFLDEVHDLSSPILAPTVTPTLSAKLSPRVDVMPDPATQPSSHSTGESQNFGKSLGGRKSGEIKNRKPSFPDTRGKDGRKSVFASNLHKTGNPLAKIFDGTGDSVAGISNSVDYFSHKMVRSVSMGTLSAKATSCPHPLRSSSSEGTMKPCNSPILIRPCSPITLSPLITDRRTGICLPYASAQLLSLGMGKNMTDSSSDRSYMPALQPEEDSFLDCLCNTSNDHSQPERLTSLISFISRNASTTPGISDVEFVGGKASSQATFEEKGGAGQTIQSGPWASRNFQTEYVSNSPSRGAIVFRDPFRNDGKRWNRGKVDRTSDQVAPEEMR
ncbi:hypothetical protein B0J11DRAFT_601363 [Dendryphion nanum]|uniref:YDG domain-containing protein n=1 Tax=Dendryphion nanum TaxID=256645 RepID=A0A9P9CZI6_9PLEO|nr:hypothetical protein B0J11DRAFT_601363 [Dendryphion nanum]